ncbi:hypothetical protein EHQ61_00805 [Leptospira wolffii]|uniref:nSTAND3 domain-containing NTPase n=1 Tax=Leptospira wolffii TaxID=409998 RepID=UPI0010833F71|nr:restriction endonuclease [Leptospira wolffii]TGL55282.1 hypothetical protein EHQ61_00805 [Leptospira wolffii]
MHQYTFEQLNYKEFEDLARDLLQSEFKILLENFKAGRDGGIDFRYSNDRKNELIIQAKHYKTSFQVLKSEFKKEIEKIYRIKPKPKRYILVTSLELQVHQVESLKNDSKGLIKTTGDILHRSTLNNILGKKDNKFIEEKYYKLWLSSTNILERIIHNSIKSRSNFYTDRIISNIRKFVGSELHNKAHELLRKNRMIIISGAPGVGKSTLAEMLIYQLLAQEYELVYISNSLSEAEAILNERDNKKQVIYFDDFLGSYYEDLQNYGSRDRDTTSIIERVQNVPSKYLVLTTRTQFLNSAIDKSEKLKRLNINAKKYELEILEYDTLLKAKILYNHIFFGDLPRKSIRSFLKFESYDKIIKHKNYNPRLIEFITTPINYFNSNIKGYSRFINKMLNNPATVWETAFLTQVSNEGKCFLETIFTFGGTVTSKKLEIAYERRMKTEVKETGLQLDHSSFNSILKELSDAYISLSKATPFDEETTIRFINPSLGDFLVNYLAKNDAVVRRIIKAIAYYEQFEIPFGIQYFRFGTIQLSNAIKLEALNYFTSNYKEIVSRDYFRGTNSEYGLITIYKNFKEQYSPQWMLDAIVPYIEIAGAELIKKFIEILNDNFKDGKYREYVQNNAETFFTKVFQSLDDIDYFSDIDHLIFNYEIEIEEIFDETEWERMLTESIRNCLIKKFEKSLEDYDFVSADLHFDGVRLSKNGFRNAVAGALLERGSDAIEILNVTSNLDVDSLIESALEYVDIDGYVNWVSDGLSDNNQYNYSSNKQESNGKSDDEEIKLLFNTLKECS